MKNLLLLLLFPLIIFGQQSTLMGDVDCNGEINSEDASLILQFVTSSINELPCEENMTGLTPNQLQDIINMINEQENSNYEQNISMIGPMYKQADFDEFNHYFKYVYPESTSNYMYYPDAIRFCSQLSYNGYEDWFLPSFIQIQNYLKNNPENLVIPNFNENTSYYFWLFLNEIQTSGNGGYLYSPTLEVTGSLHPYPNMSTIFIPYSLSDYYPHCFCVR